MLGLAIVDLRALRWKIGAAFREMSPETLWLICWIFGGLIVMSIVPSKRVDRIFPIIPPFCLLLAVQISGKQNRFRCPSVLGTILLISIFWTGGYVVAKVVSGYRDHRDALVAFGRTVRREMALHHWRYEVLKTNEEGLLLYLDKVHFVKPDSGVIEWNRGNLDAIVVPNKDAPTLIRDLRDAALSQLKSVPRKNEPDGYVLITH